MGPIFKKLKELQDELQRREDAAKLKKTNSPEWAALEHARNTYDAFKKEMVLDFRIMLGCAADTPLGLDEITRAVSNELLDRFDFDVLTGLSVNSKRQLMELRHANEDLRREVKELRQMVELMQREREPKAPPSRRAG